MKKKIINGSHLVFVRFEFALPLNLLGWKKKAVDGSLIAQLNCVSVWDSSYSFSPVITRSAVRVCNNVLYNQIH